MIFKLTPILFVGLWLCLSGLSAPISGDVMLTIKRNDIVVNAADFRGLHFGTFGDSIVDVERLPADQEIKIRANTISTHPVQDNHRQDTSFRRYTTNSRNRASMVSARPVHTQAPRSDAASPRERFRGENDIPSEFKGIGFGTLGTTPDDISSR